ncbi:hypothetical protein [Polaromonas sp.]|uniref:hypothetical protein n=1 Tax=Polaromonas sp. TaxID=1869339 RepID=UPI003BAB4D25
MNVSKLKPAALAVVALSALLALGACGKKVDDATTAPMTPAPVSSTPADAPSPGSGPVMGTTPDSGNATNSGNMGSGSAMPPPTAPASASTN